MPDHAAWERQSQNHCEVSLSTIGGIRAVWTAALIYMPIETLVAKRTLDPVANINVPPLPVIAPVALVPVIRVKAAHLGVDCERLTLNAITGTRCS